ncbi:hypothetical protein [Parasitella parasitica]|uniref:Glutathione S-transferase n=1 Tax=Parasitella parasitica TaxID=35722 RepID=A0A0B7MTA8_9FUNG|nr:hypothetical protein [Parasitella parasitica]
MSSDKIIFYNAVICPYAQRAAIALKEVGAEYETVNIDLQNKPDWYKDINPELKVPALNTEGQNIAESLVIIEYLNDRFPEKNLLPKEPLKRAYVRFAIEYFSSKINSEFYKYIFNQNAENARENFETNINASLVRFNELLLQQAKTGPYFLGNDFSLADVAIAPHFLRIDALSKHFLNGFEFSAVKTNPRLAEFLAGIADRPSVKETFIGEDAFVEQIAARYNLKK